MDTARNVRVAGVRGDQPPPVVQGQKILFAILAEHGFGQKGDFVLNDTVTGAAFVVCQVPVGRQDMGGTDRAFSLVESGQEVGVQFLPKITEAPVVRIRGRLFRSGLERLIREVAVGDTGVGDQKGSSVREVFQNPDVDRSGVEYGSRCKVLDFSVYHLFFLLRILRS